MPSSLKQSGELAAQAVFKDVNKAKEVMPGSVLRMRISNTCHIGDPGRLKAVSDRMR